MGREPNPFIYEPTEKERKRFFSHVEVAPWGCWLWMLKLDTGGYGHFSWRGRSVKVHRFAWYLVRGANPTDHLHHVCGVRHCVNPAHLRDDLTQAEHFKLHRSMDAVVIFCKRGHAFTPENTIVDKVTGYRNCRTCTNMAGRARNKERWLKEKEKAQAARLEGLVIAEDDPYYFKKLFKALKEENLSSRQLALRFGVSQRTALSWISNSKAGSQPPTTKRAKGAIDWASAKEIRRLYAEGTTLRALASQFHVHQYKIRSIVRNESWIEES